MRIDELGVGAHTTQLLVTATNRADYPVTIPLFDNCHLVEPKRATLDAKTSFTTGVIDVPGGNIPITKRVAFSGTPSGGATSLTLVCARLYWQGFGQPASLHVTGIKLHA